LARRNTIAWIPRLFANACHHVSDGRHCGRSRNGGVGDGTRVIVALRTQGDPMSSLVANLVAETVPVPAETV
jgi:hypothetical protein